LTIKERLKHIQGFDGNPIEINTVYGFQGREKSMIIFSTVRSKGGKTIDFLSDERRMNVGLSRAKSCLIVRGDSKKLVTDNYWDKLVGNAAFYG
jgi:superfamily I DNA and/or RNA helicase